MRLLTDGAGVMVRGDASDAPARLAATLIGAARIGRGRDRAVCRGSPRRSPHAGPTEQFITTPGPLGPITVLGDSVLLGSLLLRRPTLADTARQPRVGPGSDAGPARATAPASGAANVDVRRSSNWITTWRSQGWDPVDVVINLGANDSGLCDGNVSAPTRRS